MRTTPHFREMDITGVALHGGMNGAQHILYPENQSRSQQQCCGWSIPRLSQSSPRPSSCREKDKGTYVMVNRGSDVLLKQLPIPIMSQQPLCWLCVCCPQAATKPSHVSPSHQNPRGPAWLLTQGTRQHKSPFLGDCTSAPVHARGAGQALGNSQPRQSNPSSAAVPQGKGRGSFLGVGLTSEHCIYFPSNTSRGKVETQEDKKLMLELTVYLSTKCLSLLPFLTCCQISHLWFTTSCLSKRGRDQLCLALIITECSLITQAGAQQEEYEGPLLGGLRFCLV